MYIKGMKINYRVFYLGLSKNKETIVVSRLIPNLMKMLKEIEVLNISMHGFWLYVKEKEYFLPYDDYPWFKNVKVSEILDVQLLHQTHLYWPQLDVDLDLSSLENPEKYPLIYK